MKIDYNLDMELKELRKKANLTQTEAALIFGVSLRSYKSYENDNDKSNTIKYKYFVNELIKQLEVDEEHGLLTIDVIKQTCSTTFKKYDVNFCYLFGSYAKDKATEKSDVDLLIDTKLTGLDFFGLVEELREQLHKKVDLLNINQLQNNEELVRNILNEGIKIYGLEK